MINCTFENGNQASLRHVVMDGLIILGNKILLVKRGTHLSNPNKYGLPGGFLNRDETTIEGIQREILEETGYSCKKVTLFTVIDDPDRKGEDRQNVEFSFLVEPGKKIGKPDNESTAVKWFNLNKLPKEEEFAFDHFERIQMLLNHRKAVSK